MSTDDERWEKALRHAHDLAEDARDSDAQNTTDAYTSTSLPIVEAECGWISTGLIWTGYSARDQREIVDSITANVVASLLLRGWIPGPDDAAHTTETTAWAQPGDNQ